MRLPAHYQQNYADTNNAHTKGFDLGLTLVEVVVAMTVITIVSAFVLVQRSSFSKSVELNNVASEIALTIRQARTYGVTSRGSGLLSDTADFSHGVYFDTGSSQRFRLFRDANNNNMYDSAEVIEEYLLPEDMQIAQICTTSSTISGNSCPDGVRSNVIIMFTRPNPDASFYTAAGSAITGDNKAVVIIEEGDAREVIITRSTGYITVE